MLDLKFDGFDALLQKSRMIQKDVREKLFVNAARAGGRVIAGKAKEIVSQSDDPTTGRQIAKNVAVRYRKRRSQQTGDVVVSIGVLYPKGRMPKGNPDDGKSTPHWHLLELGTEQMAAQPFLRPAAQQGAQDAVDAIAKNLERGLNREIKKI